MTDVKTAAMLDALVQQRNAEANAVVRMAGEIASLKKEISELRLLIVGDEKKDENA